jgi:hypothetical protein
MLSFNIHAQEVQSLYTFSSLSDAVLALVHNAIDAFATRIKVEVQWSNWSISVKDNGSGFISLYQIGEVPVKSSARTYGKSGQGTKKFHVFSSTSFI